RSVVTKQTLQTYYVAQAGLQEALATRMLPRNNYYNFVLPAAPANRYYLRSGRVYQDPVNQTDLVGLYRYVVVGGDSARQANGTYYPANSMTPDNISRLLSTNTFPDNSPFIIISNGATCKAASGKSMAALDQINIGPTGLPSCNAGF